MNYSIKYTWLYVIDTWRLNGPISNSSYTQTNPSTTDSGNKITNIEPSVDDALYFQTPLRISDVDPNNSCIRIERGLDDL